MAPTVTDKDGLLLPPVNRLRDVAVAVAKAVARQAQADGVAEPCDTAALDARIAARIWEPKYLSEATFTLSKTTFHTKPKIRNYLCYAHRTK